MGNSGALVAAFTLASCVSPERLQLNTILQCEIPANVVYEGANLLDETHQDYSLLAQGEPVLVNPFVASMNNKDYLVAYRYKNPRLQYHIQRGKVKEPQNCETIKGVVLEQYDSLNGYGFQTDSGKNLQVGYIKIKSRK